MLNQLLSFFKNFYGITILVSLLWMTFFDSNDLINRFRMQNKLNTLENYREYYEKKIQEVKKDREELMGTPALLEKYAREKYLMKRTSEDIFIIEEIE